MKKYFARLYLVFFLLDGTIKIRGDFDEGKSFDDKIKSVCAWCNKGLQGVKSGKVWYRNVIPQGTVK